LIHDLQAVQAQYHQLPIGKPDGPRIGVRWAYLRHFAQTAALLWKLQPESVTLSDIKRQLAFARLAQSLAEERGSTGEEDRPSALEERELPEPDAWLLAMSNLSLGVLLYAANLAHPALELFRAAVALTPDMSPGWVEPLANALTKTIALQKDEVPALLTLLVKISKDIRSALPAHRRMVADIHCAGASC
jgi:hypothetical protein